VRKAQAAKLRKVVRKAHLSPAVRGASRWTVRKGSVTLVIRGAARFARQEPGDPKLQTLWVYGDLEMRPLWAWRIIHGMVRQHIKPIGRGI
jgi:hypothetical protein